MMQRLSVSRGWTRISTRGNARTPLEERKQTNKPARSVLPAPIGTARRHDTGGTDGAIPRPCVSTRVPILGPHVHGTTIDTRTGRFIGPRIRMCQPAAKGGCKLLQRSLQLIDGCRATCHLKTVFFVTTYLWNWSVAPPLGPAPSAVRRAVPSGARRSLPGARSAGAAAPRFWGGARAEHRRVRSLGSAALFIDGFTAAVHSRSRRCGGASAGGRERTARCRRRGSARRSGARGRRRCPEGCGMSPPVCVRARESVCARAKVCALLREKVCVRLRISACVSACV